jgi:hypothetical protein
MNCSLQTHEALNLFDMEACAPLQASTTLHHLLNVTVQFANKIELQKKTKVTWITISNSQTL